MANLKNKEQAKQRVDELLTEFEKLKAKARNAQSERKKEIEDNMRELELAERDLREKYDRMDNFGQTTLEEFSKEFFTSAEAFSNSLESAKRKF
ncbi:hypothetical protein JKA74_06415 [Marivirga sp. S37H4]|uniref:Uncharacterized protein n=1 Tax=Marivirga aurantiaca TaxID=2802615 RepID=A0A934WX83_9BACT|nr:hypothetical protein [Marivirga aurantiaca]MBK6264664.1 hypothetical protein [Marivirga aurantiaca]